MIVHEVITTEKVPLRLRVAGMTARFLAWLIDAGLIVLLFVLGMFFANVLEIARPGVGQAVMALWVFFLLFGYFLLFEWLWYGQTPGKRVLGIRVVSWEGTGLTFLQATTRSLYRMVDGLPAPFVLYGVGFLVASRDRENRRLGDLAAGTLVVHVETRGRLIETLPEAGTFGDRARDLMVRQRLNRLDREQLQTVLDLCLRRDQLRVTDRARLFRAVATYFRDELKIEPDEHESDEKFVLKAAAAIGRDAAGIGSRE